MRKRRRFDREFKQMVIDLSNNREDKSALAFLLMTEKGSGWSLPI